MMVQVLSLLNPSVCWGTKCSTVGVLCCKQEYCQCLACTCSQECVVCADSVVPAVTFVPNFLLQVDTLQSLVLCLLSVCFYLHVSSFCVLLSFTVPPFQKLSLSLLFFLLPPLFFPLQLLLCPFLVAPPYTELTLPALPAHCPVLFKLNFPLYSVKGGTVFLRLQHTDCITASPARWSL